MANVKITDLTAASAAAKSMLFEVTQDPGGTPATRKLTVTQLFDLDDGTKTSSAPLINMAQTWNSGGVTFTAMKINITDTASAAASMLIDLQVGGVSQFNVTRAGAASATSLAVGGSTLGSSVISLPNGGLIGNSSGNAYIYLGSGDLRIYSNSSQSNFRFQGGTVNATLTLGATTSLRWNDNNDTGAGAADLMLYRDDAGILAQRNGTAAQEMRIYGTFTDTSNLRRLSLNMTTAGVATIAALGLGTGVASNELVFGVNALTPWKINASGHILAGTDNTYDIGASGATRPRVIYSAADISAGAQLLAGSNLRVTGDAIIGSHIYFRVGAGGSLLTRITAPSDGVLKLSDNGETTFDLLQFGGTSASFPAIKRVSAGFKFVVADDSASAAVEALSYTSGAPSGGTAGAWKMGILVTAAVTPDTTRYIELDVAGTLYKVIVST